MAKIKTTHDGDCDVYSAGVCTCGSFLKLRRSFITNENVDPETLEKFNYHEDKLYELNQIRIENKKN